MNLIAILCILSWRIFWITMLNRTRPGVSPDEAFTEIDQYLLDELVPDGKAEKKVLTAASPEAISSSSHVSEVILLAHTTRHRAIPSSGEAYPD